MTEDTLRDALAKRDREWMIALMLGDVSRMNAVQASTFEFVRSFAALEERRKIIELLERREGGPPLEREIRWNLAQRLRALSRRRGPQRLLDDEEPSG